MLIKRGIYIVENPVHIGFDEPKKIDLNAHIANIAQNVFEKYRTEILQEEDEDMRKWEKAVNLLDKKINQLYDAQNTSFEAACNTFGEQMGNLENKIKFFADKINGSKNENNIDYSAKLSELTRLLTEKNLKIEKLASEITKQNEEITKLSQALENITKKLESLDEKFEQKENTGATANWVLQVSDAEDVPKTNALTNKNEIPPCANPSASIVPPIEPPKEQRINKFKLPNANAPFIREGESKSAITVKLNKAADLTKILGFLQSSTYPSKVIYIKNLEKHQKYIRDFVQKFDFDKYDEDELPSKITSEFITIFNKVFFSNLLLSVYKDFDKSPVFYEKFVKLLNDYLYSCGFYTREVKSGVIRQDIDYEDLTPLPIPIQDGETVGIIREVKRLPYYLDYIVGNEQEKMFAPGQIMVNVDAVQA